MSTGNQGREIAAAQNRQIVAARELLKPTPVRLHHVPNWLRLRILAAIRAGRIPRAPWNRYCGTDGWSVLMHVQSCIGDRFLDHFGSTHYRGRPCFVNEPYLSSEDMDKNRRFAELLGLHWVVSSNSWWFPGNTTRIAFWEPDEGGAEC
jgi:hypothetical protein